MTNYKQVWKDVLFVGCIFCVLMTGVCLIFSPWLKDAVMKTKTSQLNMEHFSAQEINNHTKNRKFENDVTKIETPSATSVLANINKVDQTNVIGEITIADVHLRLPILKGTNTHNLLVGATTLKETQVMGEGNYILAGHHMKDEGMLFGPLLQVQTGTLIKLTDKQNLYTYQVVEKKKIKERETDILKESSSPILTLFTCDVAEATDKRFVVKAKLVHTESVEGDSKYVEQYKQQVRMEKSKEKRHITFLMVSIVCSCLLLVFLIFLLCNRNRVKK
ncbi:MULTISPECIES: class A sortase [Bacillus cereus group]|nr:class A sortase [Bacillus cereus]EJR28606.1 sortase [Bacillus cereus VD045]